MATNCTTGFLPKEFCWAAEGAQFNTQTSFDWQVLELIFTCRFALHAFELRLMKCEYRSKWVKISANNLTFGNWFIPLVSESQDTHFSQISASKLSLLTFNELQPSQNIYMKFYYIFYRNQFPNYPKGAKVATSTCGIH